jgi:quercetin dioxygenase-like cupin family protein
MKRFAKGAAIGVLIVGVTGGVAWSQGGAATATTEHTAMAPDEMKWGDAPPVFVKTAKMAVLFGDPSKTGLFIVRLKMPAGYKVSPHWHPTDENVTVISGAMGIGMGDNFDPKVKIYAPGSFFSMPAKMHHFAYAKKDTVVQVTAMGPFALTYINPEDDPSKQAASK